MGKTKKTPIGASLNLKNPPLAQQKRGTFPLPGEPGPLVVQFPLHLSTQGKYDAATALCVAAKTLLEEADREVDTARDVEAPPPDPGDVTLTDTLRGVIDAVEAEGASRDALAYATAQLGPVRAAALARISAFTIEDMQRCINVAGNTRNRERWTASQWLMLYDGYKQSGWDFTPDEWTEAQVEDVLVRGLPPSWDENENPIERVPS